MTTYTVSYFIKNATTFEEGATVTDLGNGWFRVVKQTDIEPPMDPLEHAKTLVLPFGSTLHTIEAGPTAAGFVPPKTKRKAAWKQNPLNRFRVRSKA
jgi:hypothetical protein